MIADLPPPSFDIYIPRQSFRQQTVVVFDEKIIRKNRIEIEPQAFNYFKEELIRLTNDNATDVFLDVKLEELMDRWFSNTAHSSSPEEIISDESFQLIVAYGRQMIPAILKKLKSQPGNLVWALNLITGENISDSPITINDASKKWVQWGLKTGLIS